LPKSRMSMQREVANDAEALLSKTDAWSNLIS
jgi:hypothetical protein